MRARRSISGLMALAMVCTGLGALAGPASAGGPTTVEYPGPSCLSDTTHDLQTCIQSVEAGSTIILTRQINDGDSALIRKDLTLKATSRSLHPRLDRLSVSVADGDPSLDVTVQDIWVDDEVTVSLGQGSGHQVSLRRLSVGSGVPDPEGMHITASVPSTVVVEGSSIRSDDESQDDVLALTVDDPDGQVDFRVVGNRISGHGNTDSASGVALEMEGEGSVRADILNNSIWDVARCNCGGASGIFVNPRDAIVADVNIVGNTIDTSRASAIGQRYNSPGTGHLSLDVFDNIFSHITVYGVRLDTGVAGSLTFRAGHNDYYQTNGNSLDGQSAGSGNRHDNPRYVNRSTGDLRLRSSSPLIDKGLVCSPGGVANLDAAGHGRLSGSRVDMGAYERGAGSPTGVARVGTSGDNTLEGTSGDDILCGYAGDDTLRGKGGRDYLDGGSDADRLTGGSGPDRSYGGSGKDTLCSRDGVRGNDRADGGSGTDKGRTDSGDTRISIEGSAAC